jgi:hypothetical protein
MACSIMLARLFWDTNVLTKELARRAKLLEDDSSTFT